MNAKSPATSRTADMFSDRRSRQVSTEIPVEGCRRGRAVQLKIADNQAWYLRTSYVDDLKLVQQTLQQLPVS